MKLLCKYENIQNLKEKCRIIFDCLPYQTCVCGCLIILIQRYFIEIFMGKDRTETDVGKNYLENEEDSNHFSSTSMT